MTSEPTEVTPRHRIALIAVYFGALPSYIELVIRSCALNRTIDWLIFTDGATFTTLPENVKVIPIRFEDFRKLAQSRFDFPIALSRPYKVCDFKPAFGYILSQTGWLDGYHFWGHCDLDVIFGDLRTFLTPGVLDSFDKVFTRGHLTLYRNHPAVNEMFMLPADGLDYRAVFSSPTSWDFDEMPGINRIARSHGIPQYPSAGVLGDLDPLSERLVLWDPGTARGTTNHFVQSFYWEEGRTFQGWWRPGRGILQTELAYLHLQKRVLNPPDWYPDEPPRAFYVTPKGFARKTRRTTLADLFHHNSYSVPGWIASSIQRRRDRRYYVTTYGARYREFVE